MNKKKTKKHFTQKCDTIMGIWSAVWSPRSPGDRVTVTQPVCSERKSWWQWGHKKDRENVWEKALPWQTSRCPSMFTQGETDRLPDRWKKKLCHNECMQQHVRKQEHAHWQSQVANFFPSHIHSAGYILLCKLIVLVNAKEENWLHRFSMCFFLYGIFLT